MDINGEREWRWKIREWRSKSLLNLTFSSKRQLRSQKVIKECSDKFNFCLRLTTCKTKKGFLSTDTVQKMKFSVKDFFSKCDQIRRELKKSLMENFFFCAVPCPIYRSKFTHVLRKNSQMKYCSKLINCEICGKLFKSKQALLGHHNAKHTEKFKCDLRWKYFENFSKSDRHKMTKILI